MRNYRKRKIGLTGKALSVALVAVVAVAILFTVGSSNYTATATSEDWEIVAGRELTEADIIRIEEGFATYVEDLNYGTASSVKTFREIILYTEYVDDGAMVVYNFDKDSYYAVEGEYCTAYMNADNFRKLGAPISSVGEYVLSGNAYGKEELSGTYTAQLFEKGVLIDAGETVAMHVAAMEETANGYKLHPVIDDQNILAKMDGELKYFGKVDGELHPLKTVEIETESAETSYTYRLFANYRACCVYIEYSADYTIIAQYVYMGKNFNLTDGELIAVQLPVCCVTTSNMICDGSEPVETAALEYYRNYNTDGNESDLIAEFAECYDRLYAAGYVAGYRCSKIKMWDLLVLDLRFGDGTTGFDAAGTGERERMTCLVYNPVQDKVYPVSGNYFLLFKNDDGIGRKSLGYPESDVMYNVELGGVIFTEIQLFKNGYIYKNALGTYVGIIGKLYDEETDSVLPAICPNIPDRYGAEIERRDKDGVIYINYTGGAVRCELTLNKSKYWYTMYNGRNFDFNSAAYTPEAVDMDILLDESDLVASGTMPSDSNRQLIDFDSVIKPMLIDKYEELYEDGFVCGYTEEAFKGAWNTVYAQQFVVGDSTAMIFGEERPNVCALVFNPKTNEVYLIKDDVIKTWQSYYRTAGAPTSDEYQVSGCEFYFQTFDYGMTIRNGNMIVFTEDFDSPEQYVAERARYDFDYPTHNKSQEDGYIG